MNVKFLLQREKKRDETIAGWGGTMIYMLQPKASPFNCCSPEFFFFFGFIIVLENFGNTIKIMIMIVIHLHFAE